MEPVSWGVLAATTAGKWAAKQLAGTAWKEKVEPVFKKSGLDHELASAYEAGFTAFVDALRGPFEIDEARDACLREMFADAGFQAILAELPQTRFEDVDTAPALHLFDGLGPPDATIEDFHFAWRSLGRAYTRKIAGTTHASKLAELSRLDKIEAYLAELVARDRPPDEDAGLTAYRRYVRDLYSLADTRGLFWREKESTGEAIRLADIFVETLLQCQEALVTRKHPSKPQIPYGPAREELSVNEAPRTVADVLGRERRLVILGPPGSGKSTLAQCLALTLAGEETALETGLPAEIVPVLLTLKTYAGSLKTRSNLRLDAFLEEELGRQLPDLQTLLAGDRALVLFDGLDEVFDDDHRRWVSDEVSRLMSLYPRARFVLTSRPHGYRAAPLKAAVPLFEMVPFDDERIRQFFHGWFGALESQGYDRERRATPGQRANELTRDVLARAEIRSLAENPMLCTLIVLVHRSRSGRLPERRVKFYKAAVDVLTEHWEKAKHSPKQDVPLDFPEPELMLGVLSEVAWKAQTELVAREIPENTLRSWIETALADDPGWSARRRNAARDVLRVIQERTGLLVDAGGERYQFVHQSLQEYLVAYYLLDRLDDAQCCRVARHFVHAPEWEEILHLTIGGASRNRSDALVRAILDEPTSEWEEISRRDLRFVCRCLLDRPNVSEGVRADVRSMWVKVLAEGSYDDVLALIIDGVGLGLTPETRAVVGFYLAFGNWFVRRRAVEYFVKIGAIDEPTRAAIQALLAEDDIGGVRHSAVEYFVKIGATDEPTRAAFQARLADSNRFVRLSAVEYFAEIGADDELSRAAIYARLADDDGRVRYGAIEYFARIGAADQLTRAAIYARFADGNALVRGGAVEYFTQIGAADEPTRAAIRARLADEDGNVRFSAVEYFTQIGADDEPTRAAVEARLADDDGMVRLSAVLYFAQFGAADEPTRGAFQARLANDDVFVRQSAVDYFAQIGAVDESIRSAIQACLADDDFRVRQSAIEYFAKIGAADVPTRLAVQTRLADDDGSVRQSAVEYFAQIGADDGPTRVAIQARLADDNQRVQAAAIEFFIRTGLRGRSVTVLDAYSAGASAVTIGETDTKLCIAIGHAAAEDDSLLKRITEEQISHFKRSRAIAAAAERRDQFRRESTSLANVLAADGGATPRSVSQAS